MSYEINVARNGEHLFATAPRSLMQEEQARSLYHEFVQKFTDCEITVTYCSGRRELVDLEKENSSQLCS